MILKVEYSSYEPHVPARKGSSPVTWDASLSLAQQSRIEDLYLIRLENLHCAVNEFWHLLRRH